MTNVVQRDSLGIIGTARIARRFARANVESNCISVDAVASRDEVRAASFAHDEGISRSYSSYEALLADRRIDIVYVALPNALHAKWTCLALEAGKHVICEKPLAATESDARACYDTARRVGKHLLEGFPYLAQPLFARLMDLLASGELGRLRIIQASFGFPLADAHDIRWQPALGGGALLDVGVYLISLTRVLTGERPAQIASWSDIGSTGVDCTTFATMIFPGGVVAQIACSLTCHLNRTALLIFENGVVETDFLNHSDDGVSPTLIVTRGRNKVSYSDEALTGVNGFKAEADSFSDLVRGRDVQYFGLTSSQSIDNAWAVEQIKRRIIMSPKANSIDTTN